MLRRAQVSNKSVPSLLEKCIPPAKTLFDSHRLLTTDLREVATDLREVATDLRKVATDLREVARKVATDLREVPTEGGHY